MVPIALLLRRAGAELSRRLDLFTELDTMYEYLEGEIFRQAPTSLVLDVGGVGYADDHQTRQEKPGCREVSARWRGYSPAFHGLSFQGLIRRL